MIERSAKGTKGCFLKSPIFSEDRKKIVDFETVFRVYGERDENGRKPFKDYKIDHYDLFCTLDTGCFIDEPTEDGYDGILTYPGLRKYNKTNE